MFGDVVTLTSSRQIAKASGALRSEHNRLEFAVMLEPEALCTRASKSSICPSIRSEGGGSKIRVITGRFLRALRA
jgi:hypothetical protein